MVVGAALATFRAAQAGVNLYAFTMATVLVAGLISAWLERTFPYEPDWTRSHRDTLTDTIHLLVNVGSNHLGILALVLLADLGVPNLGVWPVNWPFLAQLVLAILIAELGFYWVHRISHAVPLLWRFHAVHHSARRLYWLNSERRHPVNHWLEIIVGPGLVALLGSGTEVLAVQGTMTVVHLMFQHSNADYRVGPLRYVFAVSEMHRYHHLRDTRECMVNYGGLLAIWDLVFGTYCARRDRVGAGEVGIEETPYPDDYLGQFVHPFRPPRAPS